MTILYIGSNIEFIKKLSHENQFNLVIKRNGVEAINELEQNNIIEFIISDYDLPGNDGLYFFNKINDRFGSKKIPYILLVQEYNKAIYQTAFKIGVNDCFVINKVNTIQIANRLKSIENQPVNDILKNDNEVNKINYKLPLSKRIFDVVVASTLLILLLPILFIIIIAIRIESKGKVYYTAKRVGRKTFNFYKLRSMKNGADKQLKDLAKFKNQYNNIDNKQIEDNESNKFCAKCLELPRGQYCSPLKYNGFDKICESLHDYQKNIIASKTSSFIKIVDDPRITRIGKIIRNTSIDELPQLINVIKGDMSLVGNRPLPLYEAELLTKDQLSKRFLAPAGITGLWQVELRGKGGDMSEDERITLDNKYADHFTRNNYSFWFDMNLLLRTIPALFQQSTV